jgi:hypothetical protein
MQHSELQSAECRVQRAEIAECSLLRAPRRIHNLISTSSVCRSLAPASPMDVSQVRMVSIPPLDVVHVHWYIGGPPPTPAPPVVSTLSAPRVLDAREVQRTCWHPVDHPGRHALHQMTVVNISACSQLIDRTAITSAWQPAHQQEQPAPQRGSFSQRGSQHSIHMIHAYDLTSQRSFSQVTGVQRCI